MLNVINVLRELVVQGLNALIDPINSVLTNKRGDVRKVFSVLGIGKIDPIQAPTPIQLPALAEGGIVKARPGGTAIIAGEGGQDEAVVPLGGMTPLISSYDMESFKQLLYEATMLPNELYLAYKDMIESFGLDKLKTLFEDMRARTGLDYTTVLSDHMDGVRRVDLMEEIFDEFIDYLQYIVEQSPLDKVAGGTIIGSSGAATASENWMRQLYGGERIPLEGNRRWGHTNRANDRTTQLWRPEQEGRASFIAPPIAETRPGVGSGILNFLGDQAQGIGQMATGELGKIIPLLGELGGTVLSLFQAFSPMQTIFEAISDVILPLVQDALAPLLSLFKQIGTLVGKFLTPVFKALAVPLKLLAIVLGTAFNVISTILKTITFGLLNLGQVDLDFPESATSTTTNDTTTRNNATFRAASHTYVTQNIYDNHIYGGSLQDFAVLIREEFERLDAIRA